MMISLHLYGCSLRTALITVIVIIARGIVIIVVIIGIIFSYYKIAIIGLILLLGMLLFQIITLPVEFNASRRAVVAIESNPRFTDVDIKGAKKVLSAAALTYVAALMQSILMFLYYATRFLGRRRD